MRSLRLAALVCLAPIAALELSAQQAPADTTDFHKGQWAAQFTAGTTFQSAGVLLFRSKQSAWLFDASLNYRNGGATTDTLTENGWSGAATIRAGLRGYKPIAPSTLFFGTIGLLLQGSQDHQVASFESSDLTTWGVGGFGEVGANYMITPHLSLGAAASVRVLYLETRITGSVGGSGTTGTTGSQFQASLGLLSLVAAIYF